MNGTSLVELKEMKVSKYEVVYSHICASVGEGGVSIYFIVLFFPTGIYSQLSVIGTEAKSVRPGIKLDIDDC